MHRHDHLGNRRHADDVGSQSSQHPILGPRFEIGPRHRDKDSGTRRNSQFGRRSAGGEVRLVLVENYVLSNAPRGPTTLAIEASVYSVAGWRIGSRIEFVSKTLFMFSFADKEQLKLFAGQIDPADSSHFTFDYEISSAATQYGTIDCWLNTNDGVTFRQTINTAPKK